MTKQRKTLFLYVLLSITTFLSVFSFFRSSELQNELEASREQSKMGYELNKQAFFQQLFEIDSLLIDEDFAAARSSAENLLHEVRNDQAFHTAIQLRIRNLKKLEGMRKKLTLFEGEESYEELTARLSSKDHQVDSLSARLVSSKRSQQDILDSLSFALEKAQMRTKSLSSQLANKTDTDYLKFATNEGIEVHFVGEADKGKANGKGVGLYTTGSRYEGEWQENLRHGEGVFYWPDGEYYIGSFVNGERSGQGKYYWPNGDMFTGEWKDDKRNGEGTFFAKDGKTVASGTWENNKLVERNH